MLLAEYQFDSKCFTPTTVIAILKRFMLLNDYKDSVCGCFNTVKNLELYNKKVKKKTRETLTTTPLLLYSANELESLCSISILSSPSQKVEILKTGKGKFALAIDTDALRVRNQDDIELVMITLAKKIARVS